MAAVVCLSHTRTTTSEASFTPRSVYLRATYLGSIGLGSWEDSKGPVRTGGGREEK